ncbi:MAG: hypothetical protein ACOC1P_03825 [Minisyncoccales bacterium]
MECRYCLEPEMEEQEEYDEVNGEDILHQLCSCCGFECITDKNGTIIKIITESKVERWPFDKIRLEDAFDSRMSEDDFHNLLYVRPYQ